MNTTMIHNDVTVAERVKMGLLIGWPLPTLLAAALPGGPTAYARRNGLHVSQLSACINGRRKCEEIRDRLARDLGLDRQWLGAQLDACAEKVAA